MARRTHYSFERVQRDRAKAAKREAKRDARAAAKVEKQDGEPVDEAGAELDGAQPAPAAPADADRAEDG